MMKKISTQQLKASIGEVVDSVRLRHDRFTIERRGEPVAVMLPVLEYEMLERAHQAAKREFFDAVRALREQTKDLDPEELQQAIDESIREVRAERAAARQAEFERRESEAIAEAEEPYGHGGNPTS